MIVTVKSAAISMLASAVLLNVSPCTCRKNVCTSSPRTLTMEISFKLKDKITGNDILTYTGVVNGVPDSIKLKDLKTGLFYPLYIANAATDVSVRSPQYNRPANVMDSLVFYFGNSVPDTLFVYTGLVNGWRGDECATIKDAGINKVVLRNQILVETTEDNAEFTLRK